jgi:hypothetical protein
MSAAACLDGLGVPQGYATRCLGDSDGDGWDDACGGAPPDCPEDITGDGIITIRDLGAIIDLLGQAGEPYEIYPGDPLWDASADVNGDGIISIRDLGQIIDILGAAGEPYEVEC